MQQYFINELQFKHNPDYNIQAALQDHTQYQNLYLADLEICLPQCCLLIQETQDKKYWIYLGLLLRQTINIIRINPLPSEIHLKLALKYYAQILQLPPSPHLDHLIQIFQDLVFKIDEQFWLIIAWYFRNSPLTQLDYLRCLIINNSPRVEFLDILILKIKIEILNIGAIPNLPYESHISILKSIYLVLDLDRKDFIIDFKYLSQFLTPQLVTQTEILNVIMKIDKHFESIHISQLQNYGQFVELLMPLVLQLFYQDNTPKSIILMLTKFSQNSFAQKQMNQQQLLFQLFTLLQREVTKQTMNDDFTNEMIDLFHKQKSDSYIAAIIRLFVSLNNYCNLFTFKAFQHLASRIMSAFGVFKSDNALIQVQRGKLNFTIQYESISTNIYELQTTLLFLGGMKQFIIENQFLLEQLEHILRNSINYLFSIKQPCFQIILILVIHKYLKKIFKNDCDEDLQLQFIKFAFQLQTQQQYVGIIIFNQITKSKSSYNLLKNVLHYLSEEIQYQIYNFEDSDFLICLNNLCIVHPDIAERHCEEYLISVQQRIKTEIQLQNSHAVIRLLQCYENLLRIFLKEAIFNSKLNVWEIIYYFKESKQLNFEEELISLSGVYFKLSQCKDIEHLTYVFRFVFEQLDSNIQNSTSFKFIYCITSYGTQYLYQECKPIIDKILNLCLKALDQNYYTNTLKKILSNILSQSGLPNSEFISKLVDRLFVGNSNYIDVFCLTCAHNIEETENYHNRLLEIVEQNESLEKYNYLFFMIQIFIHYQNNYSKVSRELEFRILRIIIEQLHRQLLHDDIVKKEELHQIYDQFQQMVYSIENKTLNYFKSQMSELQIFQLNQLLEARTQYGLVNVIYNKFKI